MIAPAWTRPASRIACFLLCLAMAAAPKVAIAAPEARLVHCDAGTCLRISGRRPHAAVTVRVAGHTLAVQGNRIWRATLPLATARDWASSHGGALMATLTDPVTGDERVEAVTLPPGALGQRIELASLVVSAY